MLIHLLDLSDRLESLQDTALTPERMAAVLGSLTPEQRRLLEQIAPALLDARFRRELVHSEVPGGGWKK